MHHNDTICAIATPQGSGALGIIRISGNEAINIVHFLFQGRNLEVQKGQSLHYGNISDDEGIIDEVMVSLFRAPASFTGENLVEISCHGSSYVLARTLKVLMDRGARLAKPGEFTQRAYLNGKMDLAQAEAVADLIASESKAAHDLALNQMRGGFSKQIKELREQLIHFASLIELELDFSEEDVEFADRKDLKELVDKIQKIILDLIASFSTGNALKNGIPVAIIGEPNVGKSTLLNALLKEDKAIVSDIAGTTRDSIEDEINISGVKFRFIDTAGIRETDDKVERIGIQRTFQMVDKAMVILLLVDAVADSKEQIATNLEKIQNHIGNQEKTLFLVANKIDKGQIESDKFPKEIQHLSISAETGDNLEELIAELSKLAEEKMNQGNDVIVSNARHLEALKKSNEALKRVQEGLANNITGDFLAMDIRQGLFYLGEITGSIEVDRDILGNIFKNFCIGK